MYEPTSATFGVDAITALATALAFLLLLALTVKLVAPETRGLRGAAEALLALARSLDPRRVALTLLTIAAALTALGALVAYSTSEALHVFVFRLNDERTIPTFYNSFQQLTVATLALLLAHEAGGRDRLAWICFGLAFIGAGLDETADLHARFGYRTDLPDGLALLPLVALVLFALAVLLPRLRASPPALPLLFSGGLLIVISQAVDQIHENWSQRVVEEALELVACSLFILALLAVVRATARRRSTSNLLADRARLERVEPRV